MRKQRTRQHCIEDFGMNHIEYHILDKLKKVNKFVRIYIPSDNVLTRKTVQEFRQIKNLRHGKGRNL